MTRSTEKHIAAVWDAIERCGQHLGSLSADSFLGGPALDTKDMPALTPANRGGIPALAPSRERVVQIARTVHLIRSRGTGWLLMTHVPETSAHWWSSLLGRGKSHTAGSLCAQSLMFRGRESPSGGTTPPRRRGETHEPVGISWGRRGGGLIATTGVPPHVVRRTTTRTPRRGARCRPRWRRTSRGRRPRAPHRRQRARRRRSRTSSR